MINEWWVVRSIYSKMYLYERTVREKNSPTKTSKRRFTLRKLLKIRTLFKMESIHRTNTSTRHTKKLVYLVV